MPTSASMEINNNANAKITHSGMKVTSEVIANNDDVYTCVFNWNGVSSDASKTSAVKTTVKADTVGMLKF